jgi:glycerate kinase
MRIVIAPDSFKESLTAAEAAEAIAAGVLDICPDAVIDPVPMADGGEGTLEAMVQATGGETRVADVFDPLGRPIRARFGLLGRDSGQALPGMMGLAARASGAGGTAPTAVVEMASASGLHLVSPDLRDPLRTTTFGTGQLIIEALDAGAEEIIVALGGSATCDGGAGCAQALGVTFLDADNQACICGLAGGGLGDIAQIDMSDRDERIASACIRAACDVRNPLTGPDGAARVYAPQKGAAADSVDRLEAALEHFADLIRTQLKIDLADMPGAGAAGGLAGGLVAFAGASIETGVDLVAEAVGLRRRLNGADLCITGEGRLDASTRFGKTPLAVANAASQHDVPTLCIAGSIAPRTPTDAFARAASIVNDAVSLEAAMDAPARMLQLRTAETLKAWMDT